MSEINDHSAVAIKARLRNQGIQCCQLGADLIESLQAQLEVALSALNAAISKARWQSHTNQELNLLLSRIKELETRAAIAAIAPNKIDEREKFEMYIKRSLPYSCTLDLLKNKHGEYVSPQIDGMWDAWQAAMATK